MPIPLERWAPLLDGLAASLDRFGTDRGGMLVSVTGIGSDTGTTRRVEWHLAAGSNHGPEIPSMPAFLLAQKLMRDEIPSRGAMPCIGMLGLSDFAGEFSRWDIQTRFLEHAVD